MSGVACRALGSVVVSAVLVSAATRSASGANPTPFAGLPLCQGLTIVTAVNQSDGDYESIKTVESVSESSVRLKYSAERTVQDLLSTGPPQLQKITLYRTIRRADLASATLYEQQFSTELPETIPETTAIGTSTAVLEALKTTGSSKLGIFISYTQIKPPIDRNVHPNVYDNQMVTTVTRVGSDRVMVPVILNDVPVTLPAIQARGDFFGDKSEFFFLDDPANPITLKFRMGIGAIAAIDQAAAKAMSVQPRPAGDKDVLQVIKITDRCAAVPVTTSTDRPGGRQPPNGSATAPGGAASIERALAETGRVDVYSIYFSFNSDAIRDESEPAVKEIAEVLKRHPEWKLAVNGHTDGIGGDQFNLDLSRRRSAAVKDALVKRYNVDPNRLATSGFGKSQPKDTNDTLEGRAHNRRVELIRREG